MTYSDDGNFIWDGEAWIPLARRRRHGRRVFRATGCLLIIAILACVGLTGTGIVLRGDPAAWLPSGFFANQTLRNWAKDLGLTSGARASVAAAIPKPGPRSIIFLPGILGSFLGNANGETWPQVQSLVSCGILDPSPTCESGVLAADQLPADGTSLSGLSVDTTDGNLDGAITVQTGQWCATFTGCLIPGLSYTDTVHVYDMTAENAVRSGYTVVSPADTAGLAACAPKCFVSVGYDWRLSATVNAAQALTAIDEVIAATKTDRVDILAHSQGGLVANALVHLPGSVGKIYRIVTLGTPFLGAPKALSELLYAEPCQFPIQQTGGCLIDPGVAQSLIENYPGVAELLPSKAYYQAYGVAGSPIADAESGGSTSGLTYTAAQAVIAAQLEALQAPATPRNANLVTAAEQFHASDDLWAPLDRSIGLLRMIGYDANDASSNCDPTTTCYPTIALAPQGDTVTGVALSPTGAATLEYGDGDGTVPLFSASAYDPLASPPVDDRGTGRNMYWCGYSHMGLAQSTAVWLSAVAYLTGSTNYSHDAMGALCPGGTEGPLAGTGLVGTP